MPALDCSSQVTFCANVIVNTDVNVTHNLQAEGIVNVGASFDCPYYATFMSIPSANTGRCAAMSMIPMSTLYHTTLLIQSTSVLNLSMPGCVTPLLYQATVCGDQICKHVQSHASHSSQRAARNNMPPDILLSHPTATAAATSRRHIVYHS